MFFNSFKFLKLAKLLFKAIDAATQFIHFLLAGQTEILQKVVAVAFQISTHLLFEFRCLSAQSLEHVINQGGSMGRIQPAAADPFLGDVTKTVSYQSGCAKAAEQHLLKGIGHIHRDSQEWDALRMTGVLGDCHGK